MLWLQMSHSSVLQSVDVAQLGFPKQHITFKVIKTDKMSGPGNSLSHQNRPFHVFLFLQVLMKTS